MKKHLTSLISAVLVLALAFSIFSVSALADASATQLLVFGDATAQGYMFPDYGILRSSGYKAASASSVAKRFLSYLRSNVDSKAELTDFSFKTLSYNELYALLVPSAERTEACSKDIQTFLYDFGGSESSLTNAIDKAVKNADVILLDLGMGDFTELIRECFEAVEETTYGFMLDELLPRVNSSTSALATTLRSSLRLLTTGNNTAVAEKLIDAVLYYYSSYVYYFDKCLDEIYARNSDVNVIVTGMYNLLPDVVITYGDETINVEGIVELITEAVNTYITGRSSHCSMYKYADVSGGCEIFTDEIASGNYSDETVSLIAKSLYYQNPITFDSILLEDILYEYGAISWGVVSPTLISTYYNILISDSMIIDAYTYEGNDPYLITAYEYLRYAFDIVLRAFTEAANIRRVDSALLTYELGDRFAALRDYNGKNITDEDRIALHTYLRFGALGSFGMYPSPKGMTQKYTAVRKAYESKFAADGAKFDRFISDITSVTPTLANILAALLNSILSIQRILLARISGIFDGILNDVNININI